MSSLRLVSIRAFRWSFLFGIFFSLSAFAGDIRRPTQIEGEWIFTKTSARSVPSWNEVGLALLTHFEFLRSFGPDERFALFRIRTHSARQALKLPRGIKILQPNFAYHISDSLDPEFEKSWALKNTGQAAGKLEGGVVGKDVDAVSAWEIAKGSSAVIVAVVDTGIDFTHEDLKKNRWTGTGWDFVHGTSNPMDDNGHGSFCAGIIGADAGNGKGTRGLNWDVSLMAVKTLDQDGVGTSEKAIQGIQYAVNHGAKIISASWGGPNYDAALYDTVKWAGQKGVLFIAAAGNDAKNNDTDALPIYPASFRLPNIISVAAYDNRDTIAVFSNYGKETVHIGAPGVQIYSTVPGGYKFSDGTSFATPFVAGTAALVLGLLPSLSFGELRERILATSTPMGYYEKEKLATAGRVNAYNALKNIRPPRPPTPTHWTKFPMVAASAHPYANDTKQSFYISHPGATHIRVHFSKFELETAYDTVILKDSLGRIVNRYSGVLESFSSSDALGDSLTVEFLSDYAVTKYGFEIDAYETSQDWP